MIVRVLLGSLIAAILMMGWQTASWRMLGLHDDHARKVASDDAVMTTLTQNIKEHGMYAVPSHPEKPQGMSDEEYKKLFDQHNKDAVGKPWAMIFYHPQFAGMDGMGMQMGIGLLYNFLSALILGLILWLGASAFQEFFTRWFIVFLAAPLTIISGPLTDNNWWYYPWHYLMGEIVDLLVGWSLAGAALAATVRKSTKTTA